MNELTVEDLDVLIEAIDDWRNKPSMDLFNKDIVSIMLGTPKNEDDTDRNMRYKNATASRDADATLLKAKLIMLRSGMVNHVAQSLIKTVKETN